MYKILAKTLVLGKELLYVPSCHSTNDLALKKLKESDTKEGLLILADEQLAGRGQRGNKWDSESGKNLLLSLVLRPAWLPCEKQFYLNIMSSLALRETVEHFIPSENVQIKWPNDLLINKKKAAGILIENILRSNQLESSVMGIGVNLNQTEFIDKMRVSVGNYMAAEVNREDFLEDLIFRLEAHYLQLKAGKFEYLKALYLEKLYGFRQSISLKFEHEFKGKIVSIEDSGIVRIKSGRKEFQFDFKEVEFLI